MRYKLIDDSYLPLIKNIQAYFKDSDKVIHEARNILKVIEYNREEIVIKSFKIPHIINRVAYTFLRKSKSEKSYEYALKIQEFVPEPIGYIEFFNQGFLSKSFFLSKKYAYDFTLREPLLNKNFKHRTEIFQAFALFTKKLHHQGIYHQDYSPGNILIKNTQNGFEFKLVDINRMKFGTLSWHQKAKNFSQLWADSDILDIIGKTYMKNDISQYQFIEAMQQFNIKHKRFKNLKKRLKGQKVVN